MTTQMLQIEDVRIDGGTQPRELIDDDVVTEYAEALRNDESFPPVVVFRDGANLWLADGYHRYHGHRRAERETIEAEVRKGTLRDAILYSVGANTAHGLRRSNADKRKAVVTMLTNELVAKDMNGNLWSDAEVARRCCVGRDLVARLRAIHADSACMNSSEGDGASAETRTFIHHKTGKPAVMKTENIGKRKEPQPTADGEVENEEPEPEAPAERVIPQVRGVGVRLAHEAIGVLRKIPNNDALRAEGFRTVADWIETNL